MTILASPFFLSFSFLNIFNMHYIPIFSSVAVSLAFSLWLAGEAAFADLLGEPDLSVLFLCLALPSSGFTCHVDAGVVDVVVVVAAAVDD